MKPILSLIAVFVAIVLLVFFISSCNFKQNRIQAELEKFMGTEIHIPEFSTAVLNGENTTTVPNDLALAKMVIFYDSTVCGSCKIGQLDQWSSVIGLATVTQHRFEPIFIFAPSAKDRRGVRAALAFLNFEWPVLIDHDQEFIASNPEFPENKLFHIFLLNKNNRVVLIGNPTGKPKLWELYVSTITELINNDGILKDEI
jgi:hypothetical protein